MLTSGCPVSPPRKRPARDGDHLPSPCSAVEGCLKDMLEGSPGPSLVDVLSSNNMSPIAEEPTPPPPHPHPIPTPSPPRPHPTPTPSPLPHVLHVLTPCFSPTGQELCARSRRLVAERHKEGDTKVRRMLMRGRMSKKDLFSRRFASISNDLKSRAQTQLPTWDEATCKSKGSTTKSSTECSPVESSSAVKRAGGLNLC